MNLFQILDLCDSADMQVLVSAVKTVFTVIQVAIPGVLIVLGTVDMFKAMASGDEKKTKEAQRTFIRRMIYAVVAFLIPFIIRLVFSFVANNVNNSEGQTGKEAYNSFFACWNKSSSSSNNSNNGSSTCNQCWSRGELKATGIDETTCKNYYDGSCK